MPRRPTASVIFPPLPACLPCHKRSNLLLFSSLSKVNCFLPLYIELAKLKSFTHMRMHLHTNDETKQRLCYMQGSVCLPGDLHLPGC